MKRLYTFLIFIVLLVSFVKAQDQWWYGRFENICDDREYFSNWAWAQTILGARLDAGSGFEVDSVHQIYTGINYMFAYGSDPRSLTPIPDLYY